MLQKREKKKKQKRAIVFMCLICTRPKKFLSIKIRAAHTITITIDGIRFASFWNSITVRIGWLSVRSVCYALIDKNRKCFQLLECCTLYFLAVQMPWATSAMLSVRSLVECALWWMDGLFRRFSSPTQRAISRCIWIDVCSVELSSLRVAAWCSVWWARFFLFLLRRYRG